MTASLLGVAQERLPNKHSCLFPGPFNCGGSVSLSVLEGLTNLQRLQFIDNPNYDLQEWRLSMQGLQVGCNSAASRKEEQICCARHSA